MSVRRIRWTKATVQDRPTTSPGTVRSLARNLLSHPSIFALDTIELLGIAHIRIELQKPRFANHDAVQAQREADTILKATEGVVHQDLPVVCTFEVVWGTWLACGPNALFTHGDPVIIKDGVLCCLHCLESVFGVSSMYSASDYKAAQYLFKMNARSAAVTKNQIAVARNTTTFADATRTVFPVRFA